jgi:hypothetical protein
MNITPDQRQAIESGRPVRFEDPETHQEYVVLKADVSDRLCAPAEYDASGDVTEDEQRVLLRDFGARAGWDDPAMDIYDEEP